MPSNVIELPPHENSSFLNDSIRVSLGARSVGSHEEEQRGMKQEPLTMPRHRMRENHVAESACLRGRFPEKRSYWPINVPGAPLGTSLADLLFVTQDSDEWHAWGRKKTAGSGS
jgi:hypothetical protein